MIEITVIVKGPRGSGKTFEAKRIVRQLEETLSYKRTYVPLQISNAQEGETYKFETPEKDGS